MTLPKYCCDVTQQNVCTSWRHVLAPYMSSDLQMSCYFKALKNSDHVTPIPFGHFVIALTSWYRRPYPLCREDSRNVLWRHEIRDVFPRIMTNALQKMHFSQYFQRNLTFSLLTWLGSPIFCPPISRKCGDIKSHLSVRPSLCPSVRHKNFNLAHIFWSINDRALILGMHDHCDKPFLLVPCGDLDLWPISRSNLLPGGGPQFFEFPCYSIY